VTTHHAQIIEELDAKPIVIGHSFGGLIVQRLLGQNLAVAGVAIDPAPINGVVYLPPSVLRGASIALRNPANRKRAVALTAKQFRYGFGNAVSESEPDELFQRWTIPSPGRDHTAPPAITRSTFKQYRKSPAVTEYREFQDRGHSRAIDGGWRDVAGAVLGWLGERSL
jgi:non-heme chloroperoxidase